MSKTLCEPYNDDSDNSKYHLLTLLIHWFIHQTFIWYFTRLGIVLGASNAIESKNDLSSSS